MHRARSFLRAAAAFVGVMALTLAAFAAISSITYN